jgi:hypothetical protein
MPAKKSTSAPTVAPAKRVGGRPSKFDDQRAARILEAIAHGVTYALAAEYAGISEKTLTRWRKANVDFDQQLREAEGNALMSWLTLIDRAALEDWRAAAWIVERRYPAHYGKTVQEQQHTGNVVSRVVIEHVNTWQQLPAIVEAQDDDD